MKDSTSPPILRTYLDRYPNGAYAPIARSLIEHYEQQVKLELAAREEERRLREEAAKAAEAKRLEGEHRARLAKMPNCFRSRPDPAKNDRSSSGLNHRDTSRSARRTGQT